MLREAGWRVEVSPPAIDDGEILVQSGNPTSTVLSLAWFKAAQMELLGGAFVGLAADTVCVSKGRILGKPHDPAEALEMLGQLQGGVHMTITGVCIIHRDHSRKFLFDAARVDFGDLSRSDITAYVDSGEWRGKAGGYNLVDRQVAGWPVRCQGDPTTVMGLPMLKLQPMLERLACPRPAIGGEE